MYFVCRSMVSVFVFECPRALGILWICVALFHPVSKIDASTTLTCVHVPKDVTNLAANAVYNVKQPV